MVDVARADIALVLLAALHDWRNGSQIDDLQHSLQTATRAERAGADDEVVLTALLHDSGKSLSSRHHGRRASELLAGVVRPDLLWVLRVHQDFTAAELPNGRWRDARVLHRWHHAYRMAERFVDEWDLPARDPAYPTESVSHFEPLVRDLFARGSDPRTDDRAARWFRRTLGLLPDDVAASVDRVTLAPRRYVKAHWSNRSR